MVEGDCRSAVWPGTSPFCGARRPVDSDPAERTPDRVSGVLGWFRVRCPVTSMTESDRHQACLDGMIERLIRRSEALEGGKRNGDRRSCSSIHGTCRNCSAWHLVKLPLVRRQVDALHGYAATMGLVTSSGWARAAQTWSTRRLALRSRNVPSWCSRSVRASVRSSWL